MDETTGRRHRAMIRDIVQATGYSRATVDRVLNGRGGVHPRTRDAIHAARDGLAVGRETASRPATQPVDLVLQAGRGFTDQLVETVAASGAAVSVVDLYQRGEAPVHAALAELCEDPARPLLVVVKNGAPTVKILAAARQRGKRVITMIADLDPQARDAFVGIDDRAAGQTAAFIIGNLLRGRDARVGVVVGSSSFRCHEDREIGFRSQLRAQFPRLALSEAAHGDDSAEKTRAAVRALLQAEPGLAAIYNVGGGNAGLAQAVREAGRAGELFVVVHETNRTTLPLAEEGLAQFLIGQDMRTLLERALAVASAPAITADRVVSLVDFFVATRFNIPLVSSPLRQAG